MLLDTGASHTLVHERVWADVCGQDPEKYQLEFSPKQELADGSQMEVAGEFTAELVLVLLGLLEPLQQQSWEHGQYVGN